MNVLKELGICKCLDGETYWGSKARYPTVEEFLRVAIDLEDILYPANQLGEPEMTQAIAFLKPHVLTAYLRHCVCQAMDYDGPHWEREAKPGRGHAPVWEIDLAEVPGVDDLVRQLTAEEAACPK